MTYFYYIIDGMIYAKQLRAAPQKSGVYTFKKGRVILYIGKAANLRARLRSYVKPNSLDPAKRAMIAEAATLTWKETSNDIEALICEAALIKRYRPKYNVLLRDDKNYFYVGFTKEQFPKIFVTHQPRQKLEVGGWRLEAKYIGPFTDGAALKKTLHILRRIFPYCVCKRPHKRICQYAQMKLCSGYCCSKSFLQPIGAKNDFEQKRSRAYKKQISTIRAILSGKRINIIKNLTKEMRALSRAKRFEEAASARDQLAAIKRVFAHRPFLRDDTQIEYEKGLRLLQTIAKLPSFPRRIEAYDISHHHGKESVGSMVVFEDGRLAKSQYRKFIIRHVPGINDPAMIQEVLTRRLRHSEWPLPDFILIDGGKPQLSAAIRAMQVVSKFSHGKNKKTLPKLIKFIGAMAKRDEKLYLPNKKPIALKTMPPPLIHLLQYLRDEAHRFAISFSRHRFRRQQIV